MVERDKNGRFVDGWTGGPGRPKGSLSLVTILKHKLQELDTETGRMLAEELIEEYIAKAREDGDGVAIRDMLDRTDGKPTNRHEVESDVVIRFDPEDEEL